MRPHFLTTNGQLMFSLTNKTGCHFSRSHSRCIILPIRSLPRNSKQAWTVPTKTSFCDAEGSSRNGLPTKSTTKFSSPTSWCTKAFPKKDVHNLPPTSFASSMTWLVADSYNMTTKRGPIRSCRRRRPVSKFPLQSAMIRSLGLRTSPIHGGS